MLVFGAVGLFSFAGGMLFEIVIRYLEARADAAAGDDDDGLA